MVAGNMQQLDLDLLHLDPKNYRLPDAVQISSDQDLAAYLLKNYDLDEIGESLAASGFRPEEPLVAMLAEVEGQYTAGHFVVLEGNRRLATLKLLTDEDLRRSVSAPPVWDDWATSATKYPLSTIPVVVYPDRASVAGSLGFRHVSGIVAWKAENKARYVADLVRQGTSFSSIAKMIGSRSDYIRAQYVAHQALRQAAEAGLDVTRAQKLFGVYYRSLSSPHVRAFVGMIDFRDATEQETHPLQGDLARFAEYVSFLFGDKERRPVLTDSRQLTTFARVLSNAEAVEVLRAERDLDAAAQVVGGDYSSISSDLRGALARLRRANGSAFEFAGDDALTETAKKCERTSANLIHALTSAPVAAPGAGEVA